MIYMNDTRNMTIRLLKYLLMHDINKVGKRGEGGVKGGRFTYSRPRAEQIARLKMNA